MEIFIKTWEVNFCQGWYRHNWPSFIGVWIKWSLQFPSSPLFLQLQESDWLILSRDCAFSYRKTREEYAFYWDPLKRRSSPGSTVPDAVQSCNLPATPDLPQVGTSLGERPTALGWRSHTARKSQQLHITSKWDLPESHQIAACLVGFLKHQMIAPLADRNEEISELHDITSVATNLEYFLYLWARNNKFTSSGTEQTCHGRSI